MIKTKINPTYTEPDDGEITGSGFTTYCRFIDIYDANARRTRRYFNFDTISDDEKYRADVKSIEDKIKKGLFWTQPTLTIK